MTDSLGWRYWLGLVIGTGSFYARNRRPIAGLRALSRVLRGDNAEQCQTCGRGYVHWRANDSFYERVHGSPYGTLCPACFDQEAATKGIALLWKPVAQ